VVFPMPIDIIKPFLEILEKADKPNGAGAVRLPRPEAPALTA